MQLIIAFLLIICSAALMKYFGITAFGFIFPEWLLMILGIGVALGFMLFGWNAGKRLKMKE